MPVREVKKMKFRELMEYADFLKRYHGVNVDMPDNIMNGKPHVKTNLKGLLPIQKPNRHMYQFKVTGD